MISRFQVDAVCLAETQVNLALVLHAFSIRDKLFQQKELVSILANNKQEHLRMRQQGRVFTGINGLTSSAAIVLGSDSIGLVR